MRATKSKGTRRRSKRPISFHDGQGRPLDYRGMVDLLRDHLDRGHPDSQEAADDLLTVAQKLNEIEIPPSARLWVIDRLSTLDASRAVLSWPDVEQVLHSTLSRLITRLRHTHPRRPPVPKLPRASDLRPVVARPAHRVLIDDFRHYSRPSLTDRCSNARANAVLNALERSIVPVDDLLSVLEALRALHGQRPEYDHTLQRIITRLELEHADHIR